MPADGPSATSERKSGMHVAWAMRNFRHRKSSIRSVWLMATITIGRKVRRRDCAGVVVSLNESRKSTRNPKPDRNAGTMNMYFPWEFVRCVATRRLQLDSDDVFLSVVRSFWGAPNSGHLYSSLHPSFL